MRSTDPAATADSMRLVSFDALRSLGIPGAVYLKPDAACRHLDRIRDAHYVLFPEYWQINSLCYGLRKPIFPSVSSYHIGHDKIEMTRLVQMLWPVHMPQTLILANTPRACEQVLDSFDFPFVAKAPREAMGEGVWLIRTPADWRRYTQSHAVLYAQEYLPIDRDMRLVVIGRQVVAGYWRSLSPDGFHTNVARGGAIDAAGIPEAAVAWVAQMAATLDIDYAGFDIAEVDGRLYFFEFNRLFGTAGLERAGVAPGPLIYRHLKAKQAVQANGQLTQSF